MATIQQENTTGFLIWHKAFTQSTHVLGMRVDAVSSSFAQVRNTMWGFDLVQNMEQEKLAKLDALVWVNTNYEVYKRPQYFFYYFS